MICLTSACLVSLPTSINIHPYNPDAVSSQVYAPNERPEGCLIDANERTDNIEEGNKWKWNE